eukprot:11449412-Alexandrium_andersonii.AAC.1
MSASDESGMMYSGVGSGHPAARAGRAKQAEEAGERGRCNAYTACTAASKASGAAAVAAAAGDWRPAVADSDRQQQCEWQPVRHPTPTFECSGTCVVQQQ